MSTKKERRYARIAQHGENLKEIFGLPQNLDPIALCKKVRRIENEATKNAVAYCNGDIDIEQAEKAGAGIWKKLIALGFKGHGLSINNDLEDM